MSENSYTLLLREILNRLIRDIRGPRDNGKYGWDLACKAVLWFTVSKGIFSFEEASYHFGVSPKVFYALLNDFGKTAKFFNRDPKLATTVALKLWKWGRQESGPGGGIMSHHIEALTEENFDAEVKQSGALVLVDFWAPWCGFCRAVEPIIEDLAKELEGKCRVVKVNVDENPNVASQYKIRFLPTLILFKDGEVVEKIEGEVSKESVGRLVKQVGLLGE